MSRSQAPLIIRLNTSAVWAWLARRNLSQNDLARLLGISSGYLSQMINGKRCPSPRLRTRIMQVLGEVSFEEVFIVVDNLPAARLQ